MRPDYGQRREEQEGGPTGGSCITAGVLTGRTDTEAEALTLPPPDSKRDSLEKTLMLGKNEGKRIRGRQMVGGHH